MQPAYQKGPNCTTLAQKTTGMLTPPRSAVAAATCLETVAPRWGMFYFWFKEYKLSKYELLLHIHTVRICGHNCSFRPPGFLELCQDEIWLLQLVWHCTPLPMIQRRTPRWKSLHSGFIFQHVATQGLKAWIQHSHFITQTRQELNSIHILVSFLRVLQHTRFGSKYKSAFIAVSIKCKRVPHWKTLTMNKLENFVSLHSLGFGKKNLCEANYAKTRSSLNTEWHG